MANLNESAGSLVEGWLSSTICGAFVCMSVETLRLIGLLWARFQVGHDLNQSYRCAINAHVQHRLVLLLHARIDQEIAEYWLQGTVSASSVPQHTLTDTGYDRWVLGASSTVQVMISFTSSAILLAINRHGFITLGGGQRG